MVASGRHKKTRELILNTVPIATACDELRAGAGERRPGGVGGDGRARRRRDRRNGPMRRAAHPPRVHFVVAQLRFVGTGVITPVHTPTLRCA
jgi:hypothetical protein